MIATVAGAASALGLAVSELQAQALTDYLALLERWNKTYNLTAVRDPTGMLVQHLADCLAVIPVLQRQCPGAKALLDVGSGGGLPGLVIAVMAPALNVTCIDTVGKKAAFIRQAAAMLRLHNLRALHGRVESLREPVFDVVASRAFASLADFVALSRASLAPGGSWMAMKGWVPGDEISALPPDIEMFHVEPIVVPDLGAQRCVVWMRRRAEPARN